MQVLEARQIKVPDNSNRAPNVVTFRAATFEATVTPDCHAEMMRMIGEALVEADHAVRTVD